MSVTIQLRRGTAATWTSANPTLAQGEAGLETDTGKLKLGDGTTAWNSLAYFTGSAGVTGFATPSLALGTAAAAGAASTVIRSDATIAAFDATVPVTQALGDAAAAGTAAVAARRDHKHGMPALSTATPLVESGSGAAGTGTLSSREDHVHPAGGGGMTNPMTTQDDIIVGGASGTPGRLAKGADSQVLTVDPTTHHLIWATPSSGFADPTTTKGDLIVHGASTTRLGVGADGTVLTADSTQADGVKWAAGGGGVANYQQTVLSGTGTNYTTSTTTWADIDGTNLILSLTTGAHRVRLMLQLRFFGSVASAIGLLNWAIDGTPVHTEGVNQPLLGGSIMPNPTANTSANGLFVFTTDVLTAGTHTFKPRWARTSFSATITIGFATTDIILFSAEELNY